MQQMSNSKNLISVHPKLIPEFTCWGPPKGVRNRDSIQYLADSHIAQ